MSFNWSAAVSDDGNQLSGHTGNQSGGKRTKTSHYNDILQSLPVTSGQSVSNWDIDGGLAADFDGSLSGLGTELGSTTYNMSEALLALPVFKQENLDNGFQYILGAATSPAVKVNEETLTYLNQGQSYEIKLKKLGDLSDYEGQFLRSTVRVCFHERRLQYMEKEQLDSWVSTRPGERILDIDIPLSYGLVDVVVDPNRLNSIDFIWDPTKETGIYVKVNCISTEFTAKKHGGEKGVPFRLQIESRDSDNESSKLVHCASCQIKVFKPKGADRKHKTDREKMEKRTGSEKEKYQPSYECTVLTDIPIDQVIQANRNGLNSTGSFGSLAQAFKEQSSTPTQVYKKQQGMDQWRFHSTSNGSPPKFSETSPSNISSNKKTNICPPVTPTSQIEPMSPYTLMESPSPIDAPHNLTAEAGATEVKSWLQFNRFSQYVNVFQNFSGADLLRLTRDDLIQICGLADGIRLNNALQSRTVRPRLTLYMCQEPGTVYHAVYLEQLTSQELVQKISELVKIDAYRIGQIYVQGPSSIHILLSDEVVRNLQEQSRYWIEIMKEENSDLVKILLKGIE
ncbi:transcription factor CP2-like [Mercenaria mercenaria]|uniref:transcription factor CP2-like n=1 Tax=Mercenaria mercenaria TaxID=6596 RepID=UPI001E1D46D9|nr:transcription factor CP2-like [Mercenaria mercenaria]XP_045210064.1 transcription factor CP2-like [Mercenaria mercenaria]XP_045210065.1 transcription factor CP2-like [Mercenaria mercenaria]